MFSGSYQIDPSKPFVQILDRSNLRFVGDDDAPPLFTCQLDDVGRPTVPLGDFRLNAVFNVHAIAVSVVEDLVFEGLRFSGCVSAITMRAVNHNGYADITIRNLDISNNIIAINIVAPSSNVKVSHNSIWSSDVGVQVATLVGHSTRIHIFENDITGLSDSQSPRTPGAGVFMAGGDGRVHGNTVSGFDTSFGRIGLAMVFIHDVIGASSNVMVFDNHVSDSTVGISLNGRGFARGRVFSNLIENTVVAVTLRFGANGWRVGVNDMRGSDLFDVNLVPPPPLRPPPPLLPDPFGAAGNTIYLSPGQTVHDPGGLNTIVIRD